MAVGGRHNAFWEQEVVWLPGSTVHRVSTAIEWVYVSCLSAIHGTSLQLAEMRHQGRILTHCVQRRDAVEIHVRHRRGVLFGVGVGR